MLSTQQRAADEIDRLRAELTEARRQLKEASEQKPVAYCFASEIAQFNKEQFCIAQMHNRKCSNAEIALYTSAPVPQPADDFRTRLIALCQQWTPSNLDRIESCEEIVRAVAEGPHSQPAVPEAVAKDAERLALVWRVATGRETDEERATLGNVSPNAEYDEFVAAIDAILSATDSEVKNG